MAALLGAINFTCLKHIGQRQTNSFSPMISQCINISYLLNTVGRIDDHVTLMAAVLYQTLRFTNTTFQELVEKFNYPIADTVKEITYYCYINNHGHDSNLLSDSKLLSTRAKVIILADILFQLKNIDFGQCVYNEYFSAKMLNLFTTFEALKGTNVYIENEIEQIFVTNYKK